MTNTLSVIFQKKFLKSRGLRSSTPKWYFYLFEKISNQNWPPKAFSRTFLAFGKFSIIWGLCPHNPRKYEFSLNFFKVFFFFLRQLSLLKNFLWILGASALSETCGSAIQAYLLEYREKFSCFAIRMYIPLENNTIYLRTSNFQISGKRSGVLPFPAPLGIPYTYDSFHRCEVSWTAGHIWLAFQFLGYFLIIVSGTEGEAPCI